MSIYPECEIRLLNDCEPGQLVRLINFQCGGQFAITASLPDSDGRALIIFQDNKPVFLTVSASDQKRVLNYGDKWFLNVDHRGPFEAPANTMHEARGCLIREESCWLMNVSLNGGRCARQLNLSNSQLGRVSSQLTGIAVFGKWTIYLGDRSQSPDLWTKIFDFEYKPPEGQDN